LGFGFLADLADFFHAFEGLYEGFKERSLATREELAKGRFLVVASHDRTPLETAEETAAALRARGVDCALLLNRVSPRRRARPLPADLATLPRKTIMEVSARPQDLPAAL